MIWDSFKDVIDKFCLQIICRKIDNKVIQVEGEIY